MLNSVCIMGRLTADPELKTTGSQVAVCSFTLAVERSYTPKGQEKQTDFLRVTAWRRTAELVCRYFRKGQLIALQGSLQSNSYTDKDGNKRTAFEVVADEVYFCEKREADRRQQAQEMLREAGNGRSLDAEVEGSEGCPWPGPAGDLGEGAGDFEELPGDELPF